MRVLLTDLGTGTLPDGCLQQAELKVGNRELRFGMVVRPDISFRPDADYNRHYVLVRVLAFSLTEADRRALGGEALPVGRGEFGTDFVGEVISAGSNVPFAAGDRVVPVACWPPRRADTVSDLGPAPGASAQLRRIHHAHLMLVPPGVGTVVAAALPTTAISAYALVRRAELRPGANVLVTSVTNPTGHAVVQAARLQGAVVHSLAPQPSHEAQSFADIDAQRTFPLGTPELNEAISSYARKIQGFDVVIAPHSNPHLVTAVRLCGFGARCVVGYDPPVASGPAPATDAALLDALAAKNMTLLGQRLGRPGDLAAAIVDVRRGVLSPAVDRSFFGDHGVAPFVSRALGPDRPGRVTYTFERE